jgi:cell wall-associated NlpC family hydrolase
MRTCHRFPVPVFAFFVLFGAGVARAEPAVTAQSPIWQVESGMADWLVAVTKQAPLPAAAIAAARTETYSPVQLLTRLANGLLNIRYRRGGRNPATGFDCSGFVRYVFHQGIGAELPNTSAAQFLSGSQIARDALQSGDLVFFKTRGKRVSHVGIYLGDGEFIHAPRTGKSVSVSRLSETYWSRRYAGARRPDALVTQQDSETHVNS